MVFTNQEIQMITRDLDKYYGFTYKVNIKDFPTKDDYKKCIQSLMFVGVIVCIRFETDKHDKLHIHGIVKFDRPNPYFKRLCPMGYHSKFEKIYDEEGWAKYINKQSTNEYENEQLCDSNYCHHNYCF